MKEELGNWLTDLKKEMHNSYNRDLNIYWSERNPQIFTIIDDPIAGLIEFQTEEELMKEE